jgi:hypothetical protein
MLSLFSAWQVCYAPFDLKNADVYVQDGTGMTEAGGSEAAPEVNGAQTAGETEIDVASLNVRVPVGARFTIAGDETEYKVTGRTLGSVDDEEQTITLGGDTAGGHYVLSFKGSSTTDIAFDALGSAVQSALEALSTIGSGNVAVTGDGPYVVAFQNDLGSLSLPLLVVADNDLTGDPDHDVTVERTTPGSSGDITTVKLQFTPVLADNLDGDEAITLLPVQLAIKIGEGDVSFDEKRELQYFRDRGRLDTVRDGDEQPMEVSFDATWEFIKSLPGADTPTWKEALKGTGPAAEWHTSSDDPCEPYAVDIVIVQQPDADCNSTLGKETITLEDFRWTDFGHGAKDGKISVKGTCNRTQALVERVLA